jgi:Domain of unknown function (DUF4902)
MHVKKITESNIITLSFILAISTDGYMRLTFEELQGIPLVHLISGLDEDNPVLLQEGATFAELTGYTEWVSITSPAISIGWDWMLQSSQAGAACYTRVSKPRSNLMLVDAQRRDLGPDRTATLIEKVVDKLNWHIVVQDYISTRYAS